MIIGIGGASRSGKSTLSQIISSLLPQHQIANISIDDYLQPDNKLPKIKDHIDWEIPSAYDLDKFKNDILLCSKKKQFVIAEGFLIFHEPTIDKLFDLKFFITISEPVFMKRKAIDLRWGAEPLWYKKYIWSCFLNYGVPKALDNYYVISGEKYFDTEELRSVLRAFIS